MATNILSSDLEFLPKHKFPKLYDPLRDKKVSIEQVCSLLKNKNITSSILALILSRYFIHEEYIRSICEILNCTKPDLVKLLVEKKVWFYHQYSRFKLSDDEAYSLFANDKWHFYFALHIGDLTPEIAVKYADFISCYLTDYTERLKFTIIDILNLYLNCKTIKSKNKLKRNLYTLYTVERLALNNNLDIIDHFVQMLNVQNTNFFAKFCYEYNFDLVIDDWFIKKYNVGSKQVKYYEHLSKFDYSAYNCKSPVGKMLNLQNLLNL